MRIVASVQAKRGSSRGLVHYIAHSKLDVEREPEKGRELFNYFAESLSVESANNSIKIGVGKGRPSNDELHHLVLSFRPDDYRLLGPDEKARRRALKDLTRAAMSRLENHLSSDRLSWAAAVHLNTGNPHVHIALQKQYFTMQIERKFLAKLPREALPHYEVQGGEKALVLGFLIEGAAERMERLIDRNRDHRQTRDSHQKRQRSNNDAQRNSNKERYVLRQGFLAKYEIHRIESKIAELIENGDGMRFLVTDPESGRKTRLSLREIEQRKASSDTTPKSPQETQIRTILFKMLAKEEVAKARQLSENMDTIHEASRIKERYRRNHWKLPAPSFSKDELDQLQEHYIQASAFRTFSYLESVRSDLERSGEIEPRGKQSLGRIAARRTIADLRKKLREKNYRDFSHRRYYHRVEIGDRLVSLHHLDREENSKTDPVSSFVDTLKETAVRLTGEPVRPIIEPEIDRLRNGILAKLNERSAAIRRDLTTEHKTVKILEKVLTSEMGERSAEPAYGSEELAEIDSLSLRLKLPFVFEENLSRQRALIEAAGSDCSAYRKRLKAHPSADFDEYKRSVIGGRVLAQEIIAKLEVEKAKQDLNSFTGSKRYQKFAIEDKKTGAVEFVSLYEIDLPQRASLLDRAVEELFESHEHRRVRRVVTSLVKDREQRLKDDLDSAKNILVSASRSASEFTQFSFFGLRSEHVYRPIFTSSEIAAIEIRANSTPSEREAAQLRKLLKSTADKSPHSLKEILRDFENPQTIRANDWERDPVMERTSDRIDIFEPEHQPHGLRKEEKIKELKNYGHSR